MSINIFYRKIRFFTHFGIMGFRLLNTKRYIRKYWALFSYSLLTKYLEHWGKHPAGTENTGQIYDLPVALLYFRGEWRTVVPLKTLPNEAKISMICMMNYLLYVVLACKFSFVAYCCAYSLIYIVPNNKLPR